MADKPIDEAVVDSVTDYLCDQEYDIGGRDELREHVAAALTAAQQQGQAVGRYIDWTVEGGIGALEDDEELIVSSAMLTDDTGTGTVYTAPPPSVPVGVEARREIERAIERARVFDDGSDGADAESARSVVSILSGVLAQQPAAVDALPGNWDARAEGEQKESINKEWAEWVRENHAGAASAFRTCAKQLRDALSTQHQEPTRGEDRG